MHPVAYPQLDMPIEPNISLPVVWVDPNEGTSAWVNHFASSFQSDEFTVSFGQFTPPILLGDEGDRRQQIEQMGFAKINVVARVTMTPRSMRELVEVLQRNLKQYDEQEVDQ